MTRISREMLHVVRMFYIRNLKDNIQQQKMDNAKCRDIWPIRFSTLDDYEHMFADVIEGTSIKEIVGSANNALVLDFMSFGRALEGLFDENISFKGLAVSLKQVEIPLLFRGVIESLGGDVMDERIMEQIINWPNKFGKKFYNLILNNGCGGLGTLPYDARYRYQLLNQLWKVTDPNGGIILTQVDYDRKTVEAIASFWASKGIDCLNGYGKLSSKDYGAFTMRLTRHPDDPEDLPY
jgi:hypothetical protein